jgi:Cu/Ag efflux pump CusA
MGIIMVVGVSTANSVLVTSFAQIRFDQGLRAGAAAMEAATTRLRPVLMTALAMILGVIPMAVGNAEGGEQNASLGRGVIGGLIFFGTCASLCLVPAVFAAVRSRFHPGRSVRAPVNIGAVREPKDRSNQLFSEGIGMHGISSWENPATCWKRR